MSIEKSALSSSEMFFSGEDIVGMPRLKTIQGGKNE